ncbi:MauE/DoxX family redox-associated membrane protein [Chryseobacterium terrae]|uniref:MauE/DoxX family redox-associated membrane protein n=1 Tax=Chryseobacterium terrae TaxID=3163299 RepID=A0ABW8Y7Q4_9FLAO
MNTFKSKFIEFTSYFFMLLFCYASVSKIMDFENFQVQIGQSPLLSAYAGVISYGVILVEVVIVIFLSIKKLRTIGLYGSTSIMSAFTIYIFLILNYSDFVPCSCGGILESLGWTEHLFFNLFCVIIGAIAVFISERTSGYSKWSTAALLLLSNILSCLAVIFLFLSSENIIKQDNNFTRRYLMHPIVEKQITLLDNSYYYFAGADNKNVYLGNIKFPQQILVLDSSMVIKKKMNIELDINELPYRKLETKVLGSHYYIFDGTVAMIKSGLLNRSKPEIVSQNEAYFSDLAVINDNNSFALRTQSSRTKELIIASLNVGNNSKVQLHADFLQKQSDGVFDNDGVLNVDPANGDIIYTYRYRNQFIVADSTFKVKHRLNTIDTVSTAHVKSVKLPDGKYKMEKPPLKVNGFSTVYRKLLFNQSFLKGRYESAKRWKNSKVVDVYKTDSKLYIGSLYMENRGENKVSDIIVTDQFLYAIAGNHLIQYQLTKPLLRHLK